MDSKKILVISASAGSGHVRAGEALVAHVRKSYPSWTATDIDMVDYVSATTRKLFFDSYEKLATDLPKLWGLFYNSIDVPKRRRQLDTLTTVFKKFDAKKFIAKINEIDPDYIVCTHFIPPDIIFRHQSELRRTVPLSLLITDYAVHELWIQPGVSRYFVATDKMKSVLSQKGIHPETIMVSGIPVDPQFSEHPSGKRDPRHTAVLVLSGGQGMAGIDRIVAGMFGCKKPMRIIAVSGKNTKLKEKLDTLTPPPHITLETVGWSNRIHTHMHQSDVVVTKPGGMSITEAITAHKPIIAISPIPGQEESNVEFLLEHGLGVIANSPEELLYYLEQSPENLTRGLIQRKSRQSAGRIIVDDIAERLS